MVSQVSIYCASQFISANVLEFSVWPPLVTWNSFSHHPTLFLSLSLSSNVNRQYKITKVFIFVIYLFHPRYAPYLCATWKGMLDACDLLEGVVLE